MDTPPTYRLNWAAWSSLESGIVSFSRDWDHRRHPELWWGEDRLELKFLRRMSLESFGLQGGYFGKGQSYCFVLQDKYIGDLDISAGLYLAGSFNGWEAAIGNADWRLEPGTIKDKPCHLLKVPRKRLAGETSATFKFVTGDGRWIQVPEHTPNTHVDRLGIKNYLFSAQRSGRHLFRFRTPLSLNQADRRKLYFCYAGKVESIRLNPGVFLKKLETTVALGARVEDDETIFRIFAPRARKVQVFLFDSPEGPEGDPLPMELTGDIVWEARVPGNRHGWFYHYAVEGQETDEAGYFDPEFRILDPYAKAVCGPLGPGIVVEDSFFKYDKTSYKVPYWHDLIIAEAHVRDLTAQAPLEITEEERWGYTGLTNWVDDQAFYLKQLGINAVELQPVHEFDTGKKEDYAWGYMPVNYFSPASQYCSDSAGLKQITEFRDLVQALHRRGMAVLLDVVYNHVGEPNFLQYLDKEYYFLLTPDGHYENHSGCGNTLDANTPMVRRLILDSLVHWIEAYDVDGFRFDLGELIGKETLAWLEPRLKEVKPEVVLIAEPWSFRGHIGRDLKTTGFVSWNDDYRESIRAYVTGKVDAQRLKFLMEGSRPDWSRFPAQSVNYLESHDDRCWIDKITENEGYNGTRPTAADRRRTHLAVSILMMSVGIPMLSSGFDMLKSKGGENNTYLNGQLNAIPYGRMLDYPGSVEYVRRWIAFRNSQYGRMVRLDTYPENEYFQSTFSGNLFGMIYNADYSAGPTRLLFVVNSGYDGGSLVFEGSDLLGFRQVADAERWGQPWLEAPLFRVKADSIVLPALSCALFVEERF